MTQVFSNLTNVLGWNLVLGMQQRYVFVLRATSFIHLRNEPNVS